MSGGVITLAPAPRGLPMENPGRTGARSRHVKRRRSSRTPLPAGDTLERLPISLDVVGEPLATILHDEARVLECVEGPEVSGAPIQLAAELPDLAHSEHDCAIAPR